MGEGGVCQPRTASCGLSERKRVELDLSGLGLEPEPRKTAGEAVSGSC